MDEATEYMTRASLSWSIEGREEEPFGTALEQVMDAPKHFFTPLRFLRKNLLSKTLVSPLLLFHLLT